MAVRQRRMTLPSIAGREDPLYKPAQKPPSDPGHQAAFIFIHGLDDSAEGVVGVANQFQNNGKLPWMNWIIPNAIEDHDLMQTAWYRPTAWSPFASSRPELEDPEDEEGLQASVEYIESLVDACVRRGIPPERIVLGGFSQGCALSLLLDLTSKKYAGRLAGVAGLMGYLPLCDKIQQMRAHNGLPPSHGEVPLFLARGTKDILIPRRIWSQKLKALESLGVNEGAMTVHEYEVGHTLNGPVLRDLCTWLEKVVPDLGD